MSDREPAAKTAFESDILPRILGPFDAIALVVGSIIGSGIFLKAGRIAHDVESFGPIVSIWIVVGLVTLCGSLALAELAAMLPQAGGPYVYLREAYGRLPAFLWGWSEFWIIRTGSLGALACASVISLNQIVPMSRGMQEFIAIAMVVGLSVINVYSTRAGASVQNVTTVVKVLFLASLVVLPILMQKTLVSNLAPVWPQPGGMTNMTFWRAVGMATIAVLWAYDGWINIAPIAEEIRDPQRNVPLALGLGMLIVIAVYVSVNVSYHLVLPMAEVAGAVKANRSVAAMVCETLTGTWGGRIAAIGVMCSTFGACNSNIIAGPRIYFAMARDGLLPASIHRVHPVHQTPANAILLQAGWSVALIVVAYAWKSQPADQPLDAFDALTDFVIFGGSLFYAMAVAAVFVLRRKYPDLPRPYRAWGYPLTPAIYLAAFAVALVSMLLDKPEQTAAGTLLIFAGILYYYWVTSRQARKLMASE